MRRYEAMYIVDSELTEDQLTPIVEKYKKVVTDMGGTIVDAGKWEQGRRKLAYEISKRREGMYMLMHFDANTDVPLELDRIFRISDDVFRHMIVRPEGEVKPVVQAPAAAPAEAVLETPATEAAAAEPVSEAEAAGEPESAEQVSEEQNLSSGVGPRAAGAPAAARPGSSCPAGGSPSPSRGRSSA